MTQHLTVNDLNPAVLNVQYAVRGELAIKAEDLRNKLEAGHELPFKRVINSNIGNPQQKGLDQQPLTFTRQVSTLCWLCYVVGGAGKCGEVGSTARYAVGWAWSRLGQTRLCSAQCTLVLPVA